MAGIRRSGTTIRERPFGLQRFETGFRFPPLFRDRIDAAGAGMPRERPVRRRRKGPSITVDPGLPRRGQGFAILGGLTMH